MLAVVPEILKDKKGERHKSFAILDIKKIKHATKYLTTDFTITLTYMVKPKKKYIAIFF